MAYAVIELLTLNFALNPPFRQTLVIGSGSFGRFVERWLGSSFAFLFGFVRLENANVLPKALGYVSSS